MFGFVVQALTDLIGALPRGIWALPAGVSSCVLEEATVGQQNIRLAIFVLGCACGSLAILRDQLDETCPSRRRPE